ncbi:LysR family transcriptional regulator [Granulosicoccus sp. 3-233]|uniref:LysR family transcriptional regulator n=1 Tax=Granulosicoccus sp. 3-233 TaxID=3417969 RepID=UPI003D356940
MKHFKIFEMVKAVARAGSIRKAAEDMNITASALNRRIKDFEDELGFELFERLPQGMRLNPAGELLIQHIRLQMSDLARIQSQVADLSGLRRGHVSIACSQALLPYFLSEQISFYRAQHPGITFSINVRDRQQIEHDLSTFESDLALVFEPVHLVDFEIIQSIPQPVHAVFRADHSLAKKRELRLRDCLDHPCIVPSTNYGVRNLLEIGAKKILRTLTPALETESFDLIRHYVQHDYSVGFQIPIGLNNLICANTVHRPIAVKDIPIGQLYLGQKKGRRLPVASSRFALQLHSALESLNNISPD